MSKSLEFSIGRMSNPDISCYSDSDWGKAVEVLSEEFFDSYINGCRKLKVSGQDENGEPISVNVCLTFDEEGDFQYCSTASCVCDGTLLFIEKLKTKLVSAVCCAQTICKTIEPVENGDTIDYTVGNFVILSEECESTDEDKPWLTCRFIVALPLKTCKREKMNVDE